MGTESFSFTRTGRSRAAVIAVGLTWALCLAGWIHYDAAPWIVGAVLACTLPALWDIWRGTMAGTRLTDHRLSWHSGRHLMDLDIAQIDHVRLVTRPDLSVRAAVVLASGRKLRLPAEATPPHRAFEAALHARGIRTERHHFTGL